MTGNWFGKLFADKGCIAKWLTQWCQERGIELITSLIEHTRQRWPMNFTAHLFPGILAYCLFPNQPKWFLQHYLPSGLISN
jgi:hypothetical protein